MCEKEIIINGVRSRDMKILVKALKAIRMEYKNHLLAYYDAEGERHEEILDGIYYRADGEAVESGIPYLLFYEKEQQEEPCRAYKVDYVSSSPRRLLDMTGRVIVCNHTDYDFTIFLENRGKNNDE